MVNWMDPAVMLSQSQIFTKILIAVLGFYTWECVVTLWYDWEIIARKRTFKWPMVVYWLCKYTMFWANIGLTISSNDQGLVNCQALYTFNQLMGNFAIGAASTLLMLRTIAIYSKNLYVVIPLLILSAGQWGILLHGVSTVEANWAEVPGTGGGACVVTAAPQVFLQLLYIYTMCFDLTVLILSTVGLMFAPGRNRSGLYNLLIRDGLVYFIVAFSSNAVAVVLVLLNLNPIMNVIAAVPAAAVASTVACRSFVRLSTYSHATVVHNASSAAARSRANSTNKLATTAKERTNAGLKSEPFAVGGRSEGVHVQMETFVSRVEESRISFGDVESQNTPEKDGSYATDYEDVADRKPAKSFMP